jgi:hypothetical protein
MEFDDTTSSSGSSLSWHDVTKEEILGEMVPYPVAHFLLPFIYTVMMRDWRLSLILVMRWEYWEPLLIFFFGSFVIYPDNTETTPDNSISDVTMGTLGTLTAFYFCYAMSIPRKVILVWKKDEIVKLLKYHLQFLLIAGLSIFIESFNKGKLYGGYLVFWLGTFVLMVFWSIWNRKDQRWIYLFQSGEGEDFDAASCYQAVKVKMSRYIREEFYIILLVFLVYASAYYRYKGSFILMFIASMVLFVVISFVFLPFRNSLLNPKHIKRDRKYSSRQSEKHDSES